MQAVNFPMSQGISLALLENPVVTSPGKVSMQRDAYFPQNLLQ